MHNIVFNILLLVIILYIFWTNIENLENTGSADQIREAVKQVYLADVESIRNLSIVAKKLQEDGGLVTPANMSIRGKLNINSPSNAKDLPANIALSIDNQADTTIRLKTKADDAKNITLTNNDGNLKMGNVKVDDLLNIKSDGNVTIKNSLTTDSLISNTIIGNNYNTRNKAQYIIVGNYKRPDLAVVGWSLIEIEIFDITGVNIAKDKKVTKVIGERLDNNDYGPENITNGIIFTNGLVDNIINGYHGLDTDGSNSHALKIDLGSEYYLDNIILHNRYNQTLSTRLNGTTIELFDKDNKLLRTLQTGNWYCIYSKEYTL
jgi:hypothetical protein